MIMKKLTEIILVFVGFMLAFLGGFAGYYWPALLNYNVYKELKLHPDSQSFAGWKLTTVPIYMRVYFWNWTNPEQILDKGYKPRFVELGPYTYREVHKKINVTWNVNNTITFRTLKRWWFVPELSNGSLSDNITSVNVVAASSSYMTRDWNRWLLFATSATITTRKQKIHWTHNVSEFMFDGFTNSLQKFGASLPWFDEFKLPYEQFGWFYKINDSLPEDIYNVDTGEDDIKQLGRLRYWNYRNETNYFQGSCSNVLGSLGEFWSPNLTKEDVLDMFTTDMCRQFKYYYTKESWYKNLPVNMYTGTELTLDNGTLDSTNQCYCDNNCLPSGVYNLSSCRHGAPIFISFPHFYLADPVYRDSVDGMKPDQDKHRFQILLDPVTGIQVDVAARYQINVLLYPNPGLTLYKKVPKLFIPVFWTETKVSLPDDKISSLRLLRKLPAIGRAVFTTVWIIGTLIVVLVILLHWTMRSMSKRKKRKLIITETSKAGLVHSEPESPLVTITKMDDGDSELAETENNKL